MKILHINLSKGWHGGERQTLFLLQGLKALGIQSELLTRSNEPLESAALKHNITTISIKKPFLTKSLKLLDYDLIHAHEGRGFQFAMLSKLLHRRPVILTRRIDNKLKTNLITRLKYQHCDHIVTVSDEIASILSAYGIDSHKLSVINDATETRDQSDAERVKILKKRFENKTVIGCVANLIPHKGHRYLIDAASIISKSHKDVVFILLGEGALRHRLEQKALEMDLNNIIFEGYVTDPYSYFKIFDVFALTSTSEGLGSSILDAFAYNIPVVATNAGGIPELIEHNKTGYLANNGDSTDIASGIIKIINEKEYRESCVKNAYKQLMEEYTIESMTKKYIDLYRTILSSKI